MTKFLDPDCVSGIIKPNQIMKCALVTGGSRGIGRAVCVRLANMGYHVIVNCLSNETEARRTLEMIAQAGGTGELLKFDVSDNSAAVSAIESWQEAHPDTYIEVLVNNAGIRKDSLLLWMEQEDWSCSGQVSMHSTMSRAQYSGLCLSRNTDESSTLPRCLV